MSLNNKVIWSEGMFLNPQHFQQQERYLEAMIDGRMAAQRAYGWGVEEFEIDQKLLGLGKVSITRGKGILPDGTPFDFPFSDNPPPIIELPETTHNAVIYLCLPAARQGAVNFADENTQNLARFVSTEQEVRDVSNEAGDTVTLGVGYLNLRLLLETDDLSGYVCIGLMRVAEVGDDKNIALDEAYIPTCLDCKKSPRLSGYLNEIISLLHSRGEAIAGRLADVSRGATAEVADYMLLQLINRLESMARHLAHIQGLHPCELYAQAVQMVGELSTFVAPRKRPEQFDGYLHDNLQACFEPVVAAIRSGFSVVHEQTAISLQLVEKKYGIRVAEIVDRSLIGSANFVLAAKSDLAEEMVRTHLPAQVKIGPVELIRQLVNAAMPGIALKPLPVAPRQIPFHAGYTYFQLEPQSEYWKELKNSGGFAIHVGGDFPGLTMEFWAIRQ